MRAWASARSSPARPRDPDRLGEQAVGLRQPAELDEREARAPGAAAPARGRPAASSAAARSRRFTPGREVAALQRGLPRGREAVGGRGRERTALGRRARPQLAVPAVRLLEVVADELGVPRPRALVEPRRVALVQLGAGRLRKQLVDDVADEDVDEAVARLAGQLARARADELPPREALERGVEPSAGRRGQQLGDRAAVEAAALDGGAVDDGALRRRQRVDARGEQRVDRRRASRLRRSRAARRSARGRTGCPRPSPAPARRRRRRCRCRRSARRTAAAASSSGSGPSATTVLRGPAQSAPALEELGPREEDQQQRDVARRPAATCSSRSSSVGSAQWMSSTTTTSGRSAARTSSSRRTAQFASSTATAPGTTPTTRAMRCAIVRASIAAAGGLGDRAHLGPAGEPADDLGERPVRDALAVRQAAPGDDAARGRRSRRAARARAATCRCPRRR